MEIYYMEYMIPVTLETPRLLLRMIEAKDLQDLYAMYADEAYVRYTLKKTLTLNETWLRMAAFAGHWHLRSYGPYTVVEKSSGHVVGVIGLWYPHEWPEPELHWGLQRQFWGKGYATEAALKVKEMVVEKLKWPRLISLILPENNASIAVAKRLNGIYEKTIPFREATADIYVYQLK
jgi:RimJ/RimL family protein N-acetyltransferase